MVDTNYADEASKSLEWIFDYEDDFSDRNIYRHVMTYIAGAPGREARKEKDKRIKKTKEYASNCISDSTLHGLHYCFEKKHPIRRVFWTVLLLTALGFLVQKMYESTMQYFEYPFSTTNTIIYVNEMVFPAISFCNLNDLRLSEVNGTKLDIAILKNIEIYELKKFGLTGKEYTKILRNSNHRIDDMLISCQFDSVTCTADEFIIFYKDQGERCFTFNSGRDKNTSNPVEKLTISNTGLNHSLTLVINIEHWDYYRDMSKSGIHLILHGQDETPVKMQGVILSPGVVTYAEVRKHRIKNLEAPYKTNCGSKKLRYFSTYSLHTCWLESLTDYVMQQCGCRDWFMPGNGTDDVCSLEEALDCMWGNWSQFDTLKMYGPDCPKPCVIDTYLPTLSFAQFPSNNEADRLAAQEFNLTESSQENRNFVRNNILKVVIYFNELSYEYSEQVPSYDVMVLLGDIGGQLGLFVGSSALTYFEFLDCLALMLYTRFFESFKPRHVGV